MKIQNVALLTMFPALVFGAKDAKMDSMKRITEATSVFNEIMDVKDKAIPQEILERAQCVGIVPNLKRAGFILGVKYGKGVLVCRTGTGWSAPATIRIEGGSAGLQIGAGETDLVFVVMNKKGQDKLMEDKFTVGGDAAAMAGPIGRSAEAQTDAMMRAEILSYSRARGVFAGITLDGSTLRPDKEDNEAVYGHAMTQREILSGTTAHPSGTSELYSALNRYTPSSKSMKH